MAFAGETEPKPQIGADHTINQFENASANYDKTDIDQIPFTLGLSGVIPFNIGAVVCKSAYTVTIGKTVNND